MSAASILLIDDERAIRVALRKCLEREGFKVDDCGDPVEGVKLAEKNGYGLVICDYQMPGMLGVDVLRRIKLLQPNTIRIILTAHADMDIAIRAINDGAVYRFLVKPWDNRELVETVRRAFEEYGTDGLAEDPEKDEAREGRILENEHPGITDVSRDSRGAIHISEDE
jgi:DNA-binding NtrC family response regulator